MPNDITKGPEGIRGWLILVVLGLIITPVRIGYYLATVYWPIIRDGSWIQLTTPGTSTYHYLWAPVLIMEMVGNVTTIALALVTLALLLKRSRRTPQFAILWYSWIAIFVTADYFLCDLIPAVAAQPDPESAMELIRSLVFAAIWIPYFLVSKRVKATFVGNESHAVAEIQRVGNSSPHESE